MATVEAAKKRRLTQEDCDTVKYLLKYGRTLKEIGEIIHVDPSTVGKIRLADYNLEKYLAQRKAMNEKTKENKEKERKRRAALFIHGPMDAVSEVVLQQLGREAAGGIDKATEQVAGQMQMDLEAEAREWNGGDSPAVPLTRNGQGRPLVPEADEQTKQMRFQAALMDKLLKKLDELIDVLKGGERNG